MGEVLEPSGRALYYRPVGGQIDFAETSENALRREIIEELNVEIESPMLLGVLENLFEVDGKQGHEVVFVYDAQLRDKSLYAVERLSGLESDGRVFSAVWIELRNVGPDTPAIYPTGLVDMLRKLSDKDSR